MTVDERIGGDLLDRLRWVRDDYASLSMTVENDRCTSRDGAAAMQRERQMVEAIVEEAIREIRDARARRG